MQPALIAVGTFTVPASAPAQVTIDTTIAAGFNVQMKRSGSTAETVPADVGLEVDAGPGIKFATTSYSAVAGDVKVVYKNLDAQRHTLAIIAADGTTLPGELEVFKSGDIEVRNFTLVSGTYKLICTVPGHENMKATLDVK